MSYHYQKVFALDLNYCNILCNIFAFNRYRRKVSLYNERVEDLNFVTQQRDDIKKQYDEWRKKRHVLLFNIWA